MNSKTALEIAVNLREIHGWNTVPMYYLQRDTQGVKKAKMIDWKQYKSELYDFTKWEDSYTAVMIITGEISNLTILDIDSPAAMETLLSGLEGRYDINDLANYIVKTQKGWQLFYTYEPGLKTRIGIKEHIDFLNGGISYACECNDGYEIIKDKIVARMPDDIKKLIVDNELEAVSDDIKEFEDLLRKNSVLRYKNPLIWVLEEFLDSDRIGSKLKAKLEKVFCNKDYRNYTLKDFAKPGSRYASIMHVGGIIASDPTVSFETMIDVLAKWSKLIAKIDLDDEHEKGLFKNRIKGFKKIFHYEPDWKLKHDEIKSAQVDIKDVMLWYDPQEDVYAIYEKDRPVIKLPKTSFKDAVARRLMISTGEPHKGSDITVEDIPEKIETFDPTVQDEFFIGEDGIHYHNNFKRNPMMDYFLSCTPVEYPPEFIGNVLKHLYPVESERDRFLHDLAFHLTHFTAAPMCFILTGEAGSGKNTLFGNILKEIYGTYHVQTTAHTIVDKFRKPLMNKLLVFVDEVSEKSMAYITKGQIYREAKTLIGNPVAEFQSKGVDARTYPHHALYVMASNQAVPFTMEETNDRRVNISTTSDDNIRNEGWFPKNEDYEKVIQAEVKDFLCYLRSIKLDKNKCYTQVMNPAKQKLMAASVPLSLQFCNAILDKDLEALFDLDLEFAEWFETNIINDNRAYITLSEIKEMFGQQSRNMVNILRERGARDKVVGINGKTVRVLVINHSGRTHSMDFDKLKEEF